jgi:hypothetical protein
MLKPSRAHQAVNESFRQSWQPVRAISVLWLTSAGQAMWGTRQSHIVHAVSTMSSPCRMTFVRRRRNPDRGWLLWQSEYVLHIRRQRNINNKIMKNRDRCTASSLEQNQQPNRRHLHRLTHSPHFAVTALEPSGWCAEAGVPGVLTDGLVANIRPNCRVGA